MAEAGSTAFVKVLPAQKRTDYNVIAELPGKNKKNVVMAGAHLDSVTEGPGINDNGSGSAALLETALTMANTHPENTLRFGWWAAEEQGLVGSADYVAGLSQAEKDRIAMYMNYDMVGSPNYIFMVYDADESTFEAPVPVPAGSEAIEDVYESYYTAVGEPYDDTEFSGRSDYEAFILAGIPSSGLFTGAEEVKTAGAGGDLGRHCRRAVRPLLPPRVRHLREQRRPRARGQQRPHRVRDVDVLVLDRVGQRSTRQEGARTALHVARASRSGGHVR